MEWFADRHQALRPSLGQWRFDRGYDTQSRAKTIVVQQHGRDTQALQAFDLDAQYQTQNWLEIQVALDIQARDNVAQEIAAEATFRRIGFCLLLLGRPFAQTRENLSKLSDIPMGQDHFRALIRYIQTREHIAHIIKQKEDLANIFSMLRKVGHAWDHPLLLPLIFLEVQTGRLSKLEEDLVLEAVRISAELRVLRESKSNDQPSWLVDATLQLRQDSQVVLEDLACACRQLQNVVRHCESVLLNDVEALQLGLDIDMGDTQRFLDRFRENDLKYQNSIAECRINVDVAINALESHSNDIDKRTAKASTTLAFVAMVYLPLSTIAAIFALPVFNFSARWLDIYGRIADSDTILVSFYLWYYVIVSVVLTLFTIDAWWRRSLICTALWPIWASFGVVRNTCWPPVCFRDQADGEV